MSAGEQVSHRKRRHWRSRTAEYLARRILRKEGYSVILRSADASLPISFVAWSDRGGFHLFRIVTSRRKLMTASEVTASYPEEVEQLRALSRTVAGSVNLWVSLDRKGWRKYRVHPGGIAEAEGEYVA